MLWNAGVVIFTALIVLFGLREGVRRALVHELDVILTEDLREVQLGIAAVESPDDRGLREELNRKATGHQAHRWFARLLRADGSTYWSSTNAPQTVEEARGPEGTPFGSPRFRLVETHLRQPRGEVVGIRVGASTDMIDADVARLDRLVGVAVGVVLLAAPLCGYWLAGRALKPVSDIINSATRLRPLILKERLPNRQTGDELDKLAATINGLLDRIAEHLRARRDFLANSAHELRSPLAAVRSTVEVALQSGRMSSEDEEILAVVIDQCRSLEQLVNQLLLIAETEAERLSVRREEVAFDQLVATAVDMFSAAAELHDVRLVVAGELPEVIVHGNRNHFRQIINNLLDNAIKFTPIGGQVTVSLRIDERNRNAVLTVADTGVGLAAEDLPRVFDRFFRADRARQRDVRGTGLGLAICQAAVTAHGGTITAQSKLGEGMVFTVTLPSADLDPHFQPVVFDS